MNIITFLFLTLIVQCVQSALPATSTEDGTLTLFPKEDNIDSSLNEVGNSGNRPSIFSSLRRRMSTQKYRSVNQDESTDEDENESNDEFDDNLKSPQAKILLSRLKSPHAKILLSRHSLHQMYQEHRQKQQQRQYINVRLQCLDGSTIDLGLLKRDVTIKEIKLMLESRTGDPTYNQDIYLINDNREEDDILPFDDDVKLSKVERFDSKLMSQFSVFVKTMELSLVIKKKEVKHVFWDIVDYDYMAFLRSNENPFHIVYWYADPSSKIFVEKRTKNVFIKDEGKHLYRVYNPRYLKKKKIINVDDEPIMIATIIHPGSLITGSAIMELQDTSITHVVDETCNTWRFSPEAVDRSMENPRAYNKDGMRYPYNSPFPALIEFLNTDQTPIENIFSMAYLCKIYPMTFYTAACAMHRK